MNDQVKNKGVTHGMVSRIAKLAGVSVNSASNVLNEKAGVSVAMRLKVATAAKKVVRLVAREQAKSATALSALSR